MSLVKVTAYVCFGLAGFGVLLAMINEAPAFLLGSLSAVVLGVGFHAAHHALLLLSDIRNALVPSNVEAPAQERVTSEVATEVAPRSASDIAADIAAMKARA